MNERHQKFVQLQSYICELRGELSAKRTTVAEQRERISGLLAENERLQARLSLQSAEVAQKDIEAQQLRDKVRELEAQLQKDGQLLRDSITDFETFKSKTQVEGQTKDATIRKLQTEIDGLILVNDDLQEEKEQKKKELNSLIADCNMKLHQAIQNERERVKTLLEHCRLIIARLKTKVSESDQRSLLLEEEMRTKMETIQSFREEMAEQKRIYAEWVASLKQQPSSEAPQESAEIHEA